MKFMKFRNLPGQRINSGYRFISVGALVFLSVIFLTSAPAWAAPPTVYPSILPDGEVGEYYTTTLLSSCSSSCTWDLDSGALPPGLGLNASTGVISGTPTTVGNYPFYITVTDSTPETSDPEWFAITITQTPLTFVTTSLPDATENTSYSEGITVTGGTSPYTWDITSGDLPDGLSLRSSTGVIHGTPDDDTAGSYSFTVEVTDSSTVTLSEERTFSLDVAEGTFDSVISVSSGLVNGETNVFVDDDWVAALGGGESVHLNLDLGDSQTVTVEDSVSHPTNSGIRYLAEDDSITVDEDYPDAHFSYYAEYFIETTTDPGAAGQVTDGGWYRDGEEFTATAPSEMEGTSDTQYRFSHWQLPNGGNIDSEYLSITITTPGTIIASYDTEYYIQFVTEPEAVGQVTGSGWYLEGYTLRTSAPDEVEDSVDTQYRFAYWELPTGETVRDEDLNLDVTEPGTITANYDTYYRLILASPHGETDAGTWHKAGSEATWTLEESEVAMPGVMGILGGKLIATESSGTVVMDDPEIVTVRWDSDYTRPILYISLIALAVGLGIFFAYRRSKAPKPAPAPQPQTTVVMIGDGTKGHSETTREKLLEKLSDLLEKYEEEIKISVVTEQTRELGDGKDLGDGHLLVAPGEVVDQDSLCNFKARKLLRVVSGPWKQSTASQSTKGSQAVIWNREIYNEWEILSCFLPAGHSGNHQGNFRIVYTLLNTITEARTYGDGEAITPPTPHFTDGMPEVAITDDQVIPLIELPTEELP